MRLGIGLGVPFAAGIGTGPLASQRFYLTPDGVTLDPAVLSTDLTTWNANGTDPTGSDPYILTEDSQAAHLHAIYRAISNLELTATPVVHEWTVKRGSGGRNLKIGTNNLFAPVGLDDGWVPYLAGSYYGTVTDAADGYQTLRVVTLGAHAAAFQILYMLNGTSDIYDGDGMSSLLFTGGRSNVQDRVSGWVCPRGGSATQATDASQPVWDQGGAWFVGTKNLPTDQTPVASTGTLWAWVSRDPEGTGLRGVIGAEVGADGCSLCLDANHHVCAHIGTDGFATVTGGDGDDVPFDYTFVAVTWNSSTVALYHGDGTTVTEAYSDTQSGSVPESEALTLGAINDDGTADTHLSGGRIAACGVSDTALDATTLQRLMTETCPTLAAPVLTLPSELTLIAGDTYPIRHENLVLRGSVTITATCDYSTVDDVTTLSPASPGTYSMTVTATNAGGTAQSTVTLTVVSAYSGVAQRLLVVGDSITVGAVASYVDPLYAAFGSLQLLGTQTTNPGGLACEGRSGWDWDDFRNNAASPMAPSGSIDIPAYVTAIGGATPDVIVWALGTNDVFDRTRQLAQVIEGALDAFDELRAAWEAVDSSIVHVLALPANGNARQSAFDANYSGTQQDRWKFREGIQEYCRRAVARYDGVLPIVPLGLIVDQTDGYPSTNAVHPDSSGAAEMATALGQYLQSTAFGRGVPIAYRADIGVTGADLVAEWANQGTATAPATATTTPTLTASDAAFNGRASVGFQAEDSDVFEATGIASLLTEADAFELLLVFRTDSIAQDQYVLSCDTLDLALFLDTSGRMHCYAGASNYGRFTLPDTSAHVLRVIYDGSAGDNAGRLVMRLDGVGQTLSFSGTIPAALPALSIGRIGGNTGGSALTFDGAIAEFQARLGSLADAESVAVARYT
jgi:PKD repeat protein